jgi:hypothetical protein
VGAAWGYRRKERDKAEVDKKSRLGTCFDVLQQINTLITK